MKGLYKDDENELWCPNCKAITTFTDYLDRRGGYLQGTICGVCKENRQMKSPATYECHPYKEKCKCGKETIVLTQEDRNPEYYSSIGVICECKEIVWFNLPVN
jgi:hypothetical protein